MQPIQSESVSGVHITLIDQHEQLGLGHAVLVARDWVGQDDFCVYLGDNLFEFGARPFVERFAAERPAALIALVQVEDPTAFGVAQLDGTRITRLVEKPRVPPSNLAVAGLYCFTPQIFAVLDGMPPSARGEYEITDGLQALIEADAEVLGQPVQGRVTASIGYAEVRHSAEEALSRADAALYAAKRAGRDQGRGDVPHPVG